MCYVTLYTALFLRGQLECNTLHLFIVGTYLGVIYSPRLFHIHRVSGEWPLSIVCYKASMWTM